MNIRQEYLKASSNNRRNDSAFLKNGFEDLNKNEEFLLAITSKGFGKRSSAYEYRISSRGGKGILGILSTKKNGKVIDYRITDGIGIGLILELSNGNKCWFFENEIAYTTSDLDFNSSNSYL